MKNSLKLFPHMIILTFSQSNSSVLNFECRHQYSQEKSTPKCNYRDSNAVRKISTDLFQWLKDRDSKYREIPRSIILIVLTLKLRSSDCRIVDNL